MKIAFGAGCALALACAAVGCTGAVETDTQSADESDLSASRVQVLGAIAFGDTKLAAYTPSPKYRAYSLQAKAGDRIDFWAHSTNGDAIAYLLDASFATKVTNNDANPMTHDAHIDVTIPADGTYYLAFRNRTALAADFTLELDMRTLPPVVPVLPGPLPGPAAASSDPFDPASCSGAPITLAQFLSEFTPGAHEAALGAYTMMTRKRVCDPLTGCSPWTPTAPTGGAGDAIRALNGTARFVVMSASSIALALRDSSYTSNSSLTGEAAAVAGPLTFGAGGYSDYDFSGGNITWISGEWKFAVTAHCARIFTAVPSMQRLDVEGTEREYATLVRF